MKVLKRILFISVMLFTFSVSVSAGTYSGGKWVRRNGAYFYQLKDGSILREGNWQVLDGKRYFLANNSGRRKTGWIQYCGKKFYMDPKTGVVVTGFRSIQRKTYYLDPNGTVPGAMRTGTFRADGDQYYHNSDGSQFRNGWKVIKNRVYYYGKDGKALKGWGKIDGKYYFFNEKTCVRHTGWLTRGRYRYYLKKDGTKQTGWLSLGGVLYYFDAQGHLVKNQRVISSGNSYYRIDENGAAVKYSKEAELKAIQVLNRVGWNLISAYDYCSREYYDNSDVVPSEWEGREDEYFAILGFNNGGIGDCYCLAAMFTQMAKLLGENAHFVMGRVPVRYDDGYGPHGWCEIYKDGKVLYVDPYLDAYGMTRNRGGYMFLYGTKGTYAYDQEYKKVYG